MTSLNNGGMTVTPLAQAVQVGSASLFNKGVQITKLAPQERYVNASPFTVTPKFKS